MTRNQKTKPYFTRLTDICKRYGLDHQDLFKLYCSMAGVNTPGEMNKIWKRYNGELMLTDDEATKLITRALAN